ncbi:MAG: hypothetical protein L7H10_02340 [Vulcanisaeta sp.]|jgi:hypothetical protein|nr:hypothetical protein [Vulcanisaeta sp.]MCG2869572.1 hypothetical protein [Vulcanisaeta sp.]MCG2886790.1 hypothetical protein [Vulcanisaeta sp.]
MAFELIDLAVSIVILILGFSVFTALVNDYRLVTTASRLLRKKIRVSAFRELSIPIYPSLMGISIINARALAEGVEVEVQGGVIRVINNGVVSNSEIRILVSTVITGRLGDYPVIGVITLSPY